MSDIEQNLAFILSSRYGEDVRQAIHDAIHDCYEDGKAGSIDLVAREQIANLVANEGSLEKDSEIIDARVNFEGATYSSLGEHIRDIGSYVGKQLSKTFRLDFSCEDIFINEKGSVTAGYNEFRSTKFIPIKGFDKLIYKNYFEQPYLSHVALYENANFAEPPVFTYVHPYGPEYGNRIPASPVEIQIPGNANYAIFSIQYSHYDPQKYPQKSFWPLVELFPSEQVTIFKQVESFYTEKEETIYDDTTHPDNYSRSSFSGWVSFYDNNEKDLLFDELTIPIHIWKDDVTVNKMRILIGFGLERDYTDYNQGGRNGLLAAGTIFDGIFPIGPFSSKEKHQVIIKLPHNIYLPKGSNFFIGALANNYCGFDFFRQHSNRSLYAVDGRLNGDFSKGTFARGYTTALLRVSIKNKNKNKLKTELMSIPKIVIPDKINAVVDDTLQLFYRGIIEHPYPYIYNIDITCDIGKQTPRYFEVTPTANAVGSHNLKITLRDAAYKILDQKTTILEVVSVGSSPSTAKNILCVGDSLTARGQWPAELKRRLTSSGGNPKGNALSNLNFIGTKQYLETKYEGYGGWSWASYNRSPSTTSLGMIVYCNHDKDGTDQHSVWQDSSGAKWSMETIENDRITFTRYESQTSPMPIGSGVLTHVSGGTHKASISYTDTAYANGNPFWDADEGKVDFKSYCTRNGFSGIDYVITLLTWNGLGANLSNYEDLIGVINQAKTFLRNLHSDFPNAKIKVCGIPMPSVNGGTGQNYGANSDYSNWYGLVRTAMGIKSAYQKMVNESEFDYVEFIDVASQFDCENNMPESLKPVNTRNSAKTEYVGFNGVHPTNNGYLQIADAVYRNAVANLTQ